MPVPSKKTTCRILGKDVAGRSGGRFCCAVPQPASRTTMHRSVSPRDGSSVAADRIPAAALVPTPRPTPRRSAPGPVHTDQVLVVDDEPSVLTTLAHLLESAG